jgi:hypothetical protein
LYEKNAERIKAKYKAWLLANPERSKASQKAWKLANPERNKAGQKASRRKIRSVTRLR